jgi:hypothetical protein
MTKRTADGRVKREGRFESAPEYLVWTADSKHTCEDLETFRILLSVPQNRRFA